MTFAAKLLEWLHREGWSRAQLARAAGLIPSVLNNYVHRDSAPQADSALKLARAMRVPLEWLVDDAQHWPPPDPREASAQRLSDRELMMEVTARWRRAVVDYLSSLAAAEKLNWNAAADQAERTPADAELPELAQRARLLIDAIEASFDRIQNDFDRDLLSVLEHQGLPGGEMRLDLIESARSGVLHGNFEGRDDVQRFVIATHARPDRRRALSRANRTDDLLIRYERIKSRIGPSLPTTVSDKFDLSDVRAQISGQPPAKPKKKRGG